MNNEFTFEEVSKFWPMKSRFDFSECPACDQYIMTGDPIRYSRDDKFAIHETCFHRLFDHLVPAPAPSANFNRIRNLREQAEIDGDGGRLAQETHLDFRSDALPLDTRLQELARRLKEDGNIRPEVREDILSLIEDQMTAPTPDPDALKAIFTDAYDLLQPQTARS